MLADRVKPKDDRPQFDRWLDSLSSEHHATVRGWLEDPKVSHTELAAAIRDDDDEDGFVGYKATKHTIADYRRRHNVG